MKKVKKVSHRKVSNAALRREVKQRAKLFPAARPRGPLYRQSLGFQPKDRPLPSDLNRLCESPLEPQRHPGHSRFPGG
jgi:hypothetical protein